MTDSKPFKPYLSEFFYKAPKHGSGEPPTFNIVFAVPVKTSSGQTVAVQSNPTNDCTWIDSSALLDELADCIRVGKALSKEAKDKL